MRYGSRVKKEAGDFSKAEEGKYRVMGNESEWYRFNLPRGNLVNNRSNYPARWHEDDDDPIKRPAQLFHLRDAEGRKRRYPISLSTTTNRLVIHRVVRESSFEFRERVARN